MNQLQKFLRGLNKKEHEAILLIMLQIEKNFTKIPGLIKLTGSRNLYRIRIGRYRLILDHSGRKTEIIRITKRNENTYKNL